MYRIVTIVILFLISSTVYAKDVLKFNVFSVRASFELTVTDDKLYLKEIVGGGGKGWEFMVCEKTISLQTLTNVNDTLSELGVYKWNDWYNPHNGVRDGVSMNLSFKYQNKYIEKHIHQLSEHPKNFSKVVNYMNELTLLNGCNIPYNEVFKWDF